jgi:uncharacterized protein
VAKPPPSAEVACTLAIKVVPNASRTEVIGRIGDAIKIKVHAPPVEGRANDALCEFLSEKLQLRRRDVTVLRGETARLKLIHIAGLSRADVDVRLGIA